MSDIPSFPYADLWGERSLRSVANLTRADGHELLALAPRVPLRPQVTTYAWEERSRLSTTCAPARWRAPRYRAVEALKAAAGAVRKQYPVLSYVWYGLSSPRRASGAELFDAHSAVRGACLVGPCNTSIFSIKGP